MIMTIEELLSWRQRIAPTSGYNGQFVYVHREHVLDLIDEVITQREMSTFPDDLSDL